ncbi:hypothetical protein AN958_10620 [Leucoagaricus sp. SymC.cos]|nr:hypothetical protein AN958_10620 [Leucoagaricus sp. SymC.cos]
MSAHERLREIFQESQSQQGVSTVNPDRTLEVEPTNDNDAQAHRPIMSAPYGLHRDDAGVNHTTSDSARTLLTICISVFELYLNSVLIVFEPLSDHCPQMLVSSLLPRLQTNTQDLKTDADNHPVEIQTMQLSMQYDDSRMGDSLASMRRLHVVRGDSIADTDYSPEPWRPPPSDSQTYGSSIGGPRDTPVPRPTKRSQPEPSPTEVETQTFSPSKRSKFEMGTPLAPMRGSHMIGQGSINEYADTIDPMGSSISNPRIYDALVDCSKDTPAPRRPTKRPKPKSLSPDAETHPAKRSKSDNLDLEHISPSQESLENMQSCTTNLVPERLLTGSGAFHGANNFTIHTANMIDITQNLDLEDKILDRLSEKAMLAAVLDSEERSDPPKCNPETRHSVRSRILEWRDNLTRHPDRRALWLPGSAAVGKSAVAQTVAETLEERGHLGAAFFFSRPNRRDNPNTLIPTIAYQLAVRHRHYKSILARQLADDPSVLRKHRRAQFKGLIMLPFQILMNDLIQQRSEIVLEPLVIVIDGLDECADRQAQREFVEMITDYAGMVDRFPLLWMISSREESHLKAAFANVDSRMIWLRERLEIDDSESRGDATRILEDGFLEIRRNFVNRLPPDWPPRAHIECVTQAASGHLGFAHFVIRFIGDEKYNDPRRQLDVCLQFLGGTCAPGALNPLHALDLLYTQILSSLNADDLLVASRILGSTILYGRETLTVLVQANFLNLDQDTFYRSIERLHSVIVVPSVSEASTRSLRVYHASFSDYLKAPNRSGIFTLDEVAVHREVAILGLQWLNHVSEIKTGDVLNCHLG